jgi:hypothetical protein
LLWFVSVFLPVLVYDMLRFLVHCCLISVKYSNFLPGDGPDLNGFIGFNYLVWSS